MSPEFGSARAGDDFSLERFEVIDPISLQDRPIPERRWLWHSWIPTGSVTSIYGDGGTGKSLLAQQLATACATGAKFLGFDISPCRTLGVFCEDDSDELHRRQAAINRSLQLDFADLENLRWLSRVGEDNLLMTFGADGRGTATPLFWRILHLAKELGVQFVIVDTAADTFGGNENIRPQVRQFIGLLTRLALEINGAVVLAAHPSQSGLLGGGESGSTAWNNSVRSRLYLKRRKSVDGDEGDSDVRILSRVKANYSQAGTEITLRWSEGCFINETPPELLGDQSAHERAVENAFIAGLAELEAKDIACNIYKGQTNYAPKSLRELTNACRSFNETQLTVTMKRLLRLDRLKSIVEGPPSRRRSRLVISAPDLPIEGSTDD